MKTELETKIEKLKKEDALEKQVKSLLPNLKFNAFFSGHNNDKPILSFDLKDGDIKGDILQIIAAYPPTKKTNKLSFASGKDIQTSSPYKLDFKNQSAYARTARIEYINGVYDIWIEVPENYYHKDVISINQRSLYESEHHYFIGCSYKQLASIQVGELRLNGYECQKYYGGTCVCYITDETQKEAFERVVLTGNI